MELINPSYQFVFSRLVLKVKGKSEIVYVVFYISECYLKIKIKIIKRSCRQF